MPGEELRWKCEFNPYFPGEFMIAHKPNGDCHYLGEGGCTIQADKPSRCREMDCMELAKNMTRQQAQKFNVVPIWIKGRELLGRR